MKSIERIVEIVLPLIVFAFAAAKFVFTYAVFSSDLDQLIKVVLLSS